ncbi:MAG: HlyD family efflux transporter periplasmic adaptor subunit, partial [Candidatus Firestonebacteria bacterium]|nr:HlyD family efflux transporter periplasmic adaptor subunit [Candidatus Firestonebacteria bacterium]
MSPFKNIFGKGGGSEDETAPEEDRKESKLVSSYNLTYDQIKKQEMGEELPVAESGSAVEEKKKPANRFSRLTSQFKKVDLQDSLEQIKEQGQGMTGMLDWFREHKAVSIGLGVVLGAALLWGFSRFLFAKKEIKGTEGSGIEIAEAGTQVKVLKVTKTDFSDSILAMGTIKGFAQVNLGFQISGTVSAFNFREGDEIKAGQIILQLDPQEQMLKYEEAKVNYNNVQALYDLGAVIPLKLQEAKIKLDLAQSDLAKTAIVAPTDGILGSREVEVGSAANPNMKVATFLDINDVFAEVGIMEREINKVVVGQDVKINIDAYPDLDFGGT